MQATRVHSLRISGAEDRPISGFVTEEEQFWELWREGKFCYMIAAWEMDEDFGPIMGWFKEYYPEEIL